MIPAGTCYPAGFAASIAASGCRFAMPNQKVV
jgi:hypothetical protein